jgi:hypothetical protein
MKAIQDITIYDWKVESTWMLWIATGVMAQNCEQVSEVLQAGGVTQWSNRIRYLAALTVSAQASGDYKASVMLSESRQVQSR